MLRPAPLSRRRQPLLRGPDLSPHRIPIHELSYPPGVRVRRWGQPYTQHGPHPYVQPLLPFHDDRTDMAITAIVCPLHGAGTARRSGSHPYQLASTSPPASSAICKSASEASEPLLPSSSPETIVSTITSGSTAHRVSPPANCASGSTPSYRRTSRHPESGDVALVSVTCDAESSAAHCCVLI